MGPKIKKEKELSDLLGKIEGRKEEGKKYLRIGKEVATRFEKTKYYDECYDNLKGLVVEARLKDVGEWGYKSILNTITITYKTEDIFKSFDGKIETYIPGIWEKVLAKEYLKIKQSKLEEIERKETEKIEQKIRDLKDQFGFK
ncbi:MAG: hypothetical protein ABIG52_02050 [Nanoarchaeota archaeon]